MVADDGMAFEQTVSHASTTNTAKEEDYVTLKRSVSRVHHFKASDPALRPSASNTNLGNGHKRRGSGSSMRLDLPHLPEAAETALAALQFLPTPLIVLDSLKTVVLANEAMGRLLGLFDRSEVPHESSIDSLKGQSLSQIGIDMISDGVPVWVSWEKFLDNLASGQSSDPALVTTPDGNADGELTPTADPDSRQIQAQFTTLRGRSPMRERTPIQDTAVEVVISSSKPHHALSPRHRHHKPRSPGIHATCRMIITIWTLDDQRFFTLTFTASHSHHNSHKHHAAHISTRGTSTASAKSNHSSHSHSTPTSSTSSSVVTSPSESSAHATSFPPNGAPSKCSNVHNFTDFQKVTRMKDAMLDAMHIPVIAMWRDESVVFPNQAARRLLAVTADPMSEDSYDFMSRFQPWTADFSRELEEDENPIIKLCRSQQPFARWEIGLVNTATGKKSNYDVSGYPVFDDKTNEFFAGLIAFKDVTAYTEKIANQTAENEQQFQLICDTMPQMLWTTRPDGFHDYFSQRWYDYTGLTPEECRGTNWVLPFHPDDLPVAGKNWMHSLATGDEYLVEYRCRRKDGIWRWMLGRALPLKDKSGKIIKWFGTCTDIQETVDAREVSQRSRQQLIDVLNHAQMTMWTIDRGGILTFFEGSPGDTDNTEDMAKNIVGKPAIEAFSNHMDPLRFQELFENVVSGRSAFEMIEVQDKNGRWFRVRLMPQRGRTGPDGVSLNTNEVIGVIGTSMEVTSLKKKEQENVKLIAKETAAKEASKMKSSFLANMSHEIRTPIAGVLGMSELLMDTNLDQEQSDFAQNIQRSANSLLTVINDILDFSKIESGRLDIEEVQFSLSIVLKDVAKMLSYAAARKNLEFTSDLQLGDAKELPLLGDPGRIRQILTNLLTNSIKFTTEGHVNLRAHIVENTSESITVEFIVQDTGIGIDEEVRKRLFRPFSQADSSTARKFGGTGLGLTISKNLVDLMHGQIWLSSKLSQGTTAIFRIPFKKPEFASGTHTQLVEIGALPDRLQSELSLSIDDTRMDLKGRRISPPLPQSPHSAASGRATRGGSIAPEIAREKYHILVVEDNNVNQQIAIKFIRGLRFSVNAVWNGKEALQYLLKATSPNLAAEEKVNYPVPSLILMDCQMPVLDGYHATHILRHHDPYTNIQSISRIPIIAMTASAIQGDREKCERAGMDDYLAKPVKRLVLERMILKWILKSSNIEPSVTNQELPKPALSRSGTDHSSSCADFDNIAVEVLGPRPRSLSKATVQSSLRPDPTPLQHANAINSGLAAGNLTATEKNDRRAAEKELSRNAEAQKLFEAANETTADSQLGHSFRKVTPQVSADDSGHEPALSPSLYKNLSPLQNSNSEGGIMALTEKNLSDFNRSGGSPNNMQPAVKEKEDYFTLKAVEDARNPMSPPKLVVPVTDIPGPPPDVASPGGGLRIVTATDLSEGTAGTPSNRSKDSHSPTLKRMQSDALKITRPSIASAIQGRSTSDWSNSASTIKQEAIPKSNTPPSRRSSLEVRKKEK